MNIALWLACCSSLCLKPSPWLMEKARRDLGWLPAACHQRSIGGFTLAELLISLAILGVIATFTIPKIMTSSQSEQYNAGFKEDIAAIGAAYQQLTLTGNVNSTTKPSDLTPYMNYIKYDTTSQMDNLWGFAGPASCSSRPCLKMHNGSVIMLYNLESFGGTASSNAILFHIDPDGINTSGSATNGPGKMVEVELYYSGLISTREQLPVAAVSSGSTRSALPSGDPPWLNH